MSGAALVQIWPEHLGPAICHASQSNRAPRTCMQEQQIQECTAQQNCHLSTQQQQGPAASYTSSAAGCDLVLLVMLQYMTLS